MNRVLHRDLPRAVSGTRDPRARTWFPACSSKFGFTRLAAVAVPVAAALTLTGCAAINGPAAGDSVEVLAKVEGWRDGFEDAGGFRYATVEIAYDAPSTQRAWDENVPGDLPSAQGQPSAPGLYRAIDEIDFASHALVVFSSGESGTCPVWVDDFTTSGDSVTVHVESIADAGTPCTDDFRPYRVVMAVDRTRLPAASQLPLTDVEFPVQNLSGPDAIVTTYPVGGTAPS